ncbi:hypothetical protein WDW89_03090 [Deltaproteobacteria bacterium TL4]
MQVANSALLKPQPSLKMPKKADIDPELKTLSDKEEAVQRPTQQKLPPDPKLNNIKKTTGTSNTMVVRRSYIMVISSYENIAKRAQLTDEAAKQLGKTIQHRIRELNPQSRRQIEELPEYKKLGLKNIDGLGEELEDLMSDSDEYLKAFALMKTPQFAELMESTESVHRSFSEMMQDNGDEQLMFGVIEMVNNMGGLEAISGAGPQKAGLDIKA